MGVNKVGMMHVWIQLGLLGVIGLLPALGQDPPSATPRKAGQPANRPGMWTLRPGDTMRFLSAEMAYTGVAVRGKPFSSEFSAETTQVLGDGNRITHKITARLYRDKEGRTRRDSQLARLGPWSAGANGPIELTFLQDPVAGVGYTLNPRVKTANKYELRRAPAELPVERPLSKAPYGAQRSSLGTRVIEGIEATGIRDTLTIPAGRMGNAKPIELSYERWYSPELKLLVLSRYSDPRFGETVYRVVNLRREEPDPTLFSIPSSYRIIESGPEAATAK
jgi:hypothetical protein